MLETMKEVMRSQDMCVLATVSGDKPHCSLMAYVTDEDCRTIYMITHRHTAKYRNLTANPCLSLLIDTRLIDTGENRQKAKALIARVPLKRINKPEDIANTAIFLASSDSDNITGQAIFIDGGSTALHSAYVWPED